MSIFRDFFNVKQKPVFTGSRFGFGSGGAGDTGSAPPGFSASGGNAEYTLNGYKYHVFTSSGSLVADAGSDEVEFLIIGGGGGAGAGISLDYGRGGGGGGAGGVRCSFQGFTPGGPSASPESGLTCTAGNTYPVTVGPGGTGFQPGPGSAPNNGSSSSFGPPSTPARVIAGGGARGVGSRNNNGIDSNGGSGGGAGASEDQTLAAGGAQVTGSGVNPSYKGGYPGGDTNPESNTCGGGGGAGGAGMAGDEPVASCARYGKGGAGMPFPTSIIPPSYGQASPSGPGRWFAQGGYGESADSGGSCTYVNEGGGGTNPHNASANTAGDGKNGVANTGSGAGGMGDNETGGNGGSGIVFLRYRV